MPRHLDGDLGRQMAGVVGETSSFAFTADDQMRRRFDLNLDGAVEGERKRIEAWAEVGRTGGGASEHEVRLRARRSQVVTRFSPLQGALT